MFYSHQLLARKAPLGQIWMAATMHAKINRRKLDKLNLVTICEEILNPAVPMALRLSGILMGGVVIVYERKVKLLYDDVTRLMVEINEAWKVRSAPDPTVLPKGKSQAKKEAVTLPEKQQTDMGDIEQSVNFSNVNVSMGFQHTAYFAMRLDDLDEPFINNDPREEDASQQLHQANAENIKLFERFDLYQTHTETYNRFERFDTEEDGETQLNFTSVDHMEIPITLIQSPPRQDEAPRVDEIEDHLEKQVNQQPDEFQVARQDQQRQGPTKRRTKRYAAPPLDYELTIIPGDLYQSWLQNASDIVSRRGRKRKARRDVMSRTKVANVMDLPPLVLIDELSRNENRDIYYPAPLLKLWLKSSQPPHDSPSSARTSLPLPPEPSSSSPPERGHYQDIMGYPFEDFHSGVGSQSLGLSIEKQRTTIVNNEISTEILMGELRANLINDGGKTTDANLVTPGNSGDEIRSIPSSGSGRGMPSHHVHSGRSNRKRPYSASRHSGSSLEPVEEEKSWQFPDPNFKLSRLSENDPTPDQELVVETGPTQTQHPIINQPLDKITDTIRMQMKQHFETPGAPHVESLNKLAAGMNRKGAAMLFYQTCGIRSYTDTTSYPANYNRTGAFQQNKNGVHG